MDPLEVASFVLHSLFAGLWAGSVIYLTLAVIPLARDGSLEPATLASLTGTVTRISRVSAVVVFLTGSHMAAAIYTRETITGTTPGQLVLGMVLLWLVLMATVEIAGSKIRGGTDEDKLREPARAARPFYLGGSLAAICLLAIGGLFSASRLGFFAL